MHSNPLSSAPKRIPPARTVVRAKNVIVVSNETFKVDAEGKKENFFFEGLKGEEGGGGVLGIGDEGSEVRAEVKEVRVGLGVRVV